MSQQIRQLEQTVGMPLLERTSRRVVVTEAGETLLAGARRTLAEADRTMASLRDLGAGRAGRLVIGSLGAGINGPLPLAIRALRAAAEVTIDLRHYPDSAAQERALLANVLDVAVLREVAHHPSIVSRPLLDESFIAYLPDGHRLAECPVIRLIDLAEEPFVLWPRHLGEAFYDLIIDACQASGFTPTIEGVGDSLEAQLALVAAGVGVSLQATSNGSLRRSGVVVTEIHPADLTADLKIAYRKWDSSPSLRHFLRAIEGACGNESPESKR